MIKILWIIMKCYGFFLIEKITKNLTIKDKNIIIFIQLNKYSGQGEIPCFYSRAIDLYINNSNIFIMP